MPVLLRCVRLTEIQRRAAAGQLGHLRKAWVGLAQGECVWRSCVWFVNARDRPCENRAAVFLTERTPREVLWTCEPPDLTGVRLVAEALRALDRDLLAAGAPLSVLCDWLEEHGMPEAVLLREFCGLPQRWDWRCLREGG
jgi:hypothetical protein